MLFYNTIFPETLVLLKQLQNEDILAEMRLVGGTSLALQIGHRISVDLDLFGTLKGDSISLNKMLTTLKKTESLQQTENIHIYNINNIKVDIVNYPYPWLKSPLMQDGITLGAIEDIAAMKLSAITGRGSKKDFIDLHFILERYTLGELITFYKQKYSNGSIFQVLRSLAYFDDAEEEPMPRMLVNTDWEEVKKTISIKLREYLTSTDADI
ncbi:hypothetical protein D1164_20575 [Mariniphaga sediminis]|uniref:Nucleotidyl transferase AbiEii/AbiGii toxin family protein n=1 Tax=Mariniphaga sediminis TaxID=1628158 RepID=A0A399CYV4_9BACT|nr:nucleotidyl transferase AbiEii/AbiGii toxin family protein [Mariniphaga sediminis]RIH63250.1 hypothetical protein D1164_20575 [Mariniphaga sediminis]